MAELAGFHAGATVQAPQLLDRLRDDPVTAAALTRAGVVLPAPSSAPPSTPSPAPPSTPSPASASVPAPPSTTRNSARRRWR
jgi:hypothetical protein